MSPYQYQGVARKVGVVRVVGEPHLKADGQMQRGSGAGKERKGDKGQRGGGKGQPSRL